MRKLFGILWLAFLLGMLYLYFFHAGFFQHQLELMVQHSLYLAYVIFLVLGIIRGFTLIPVTYLIVLGLLFFPPLPLFIIILLGILISSASVYYFFEYLNLDSLFKKKYNKQISRVRQALEKNELPIIIGWSAFPFFPTDVICYLCGTLEVDIKKLLLGIFIGEGITSGVYIFFGHYLLNSVASVL
jgi:uncharacterized membrane protein YdjX (TVP38/TMEM64 family)